MTDDLAAIAEEIAAIEARHDELTQQLEAIEDELLSLERQLQAYRTFLARYQMPVH